jgi:hypothetical protein
MGHLAKATYKGKIMLATGTSISKPSGPGKPAFSHIFQNAITGNIIAAMESRNTGIKTTKNTSKGAAFTQVVFIIIS